jgi:GPH family glycoside/pentoside/hexuronide:cation symporter
VSRVFDAVNDSLMGTIADRTQTRWGKCRPYLLWLAVPFGLAGFLAFSSPDCATCTNTPS